MIKAYERIAQGLLKGQPKAKKFAKFENGKLYTGTKSLHRTTQSVRWRMFWRLKKNRLKIEL